MPKRRVGCPDRSVEDLFDQSTPRPLRRFLIGHEVRTALQMGWDRLENGALLDAAEANGFHLLVTCDRNLRYQQNLTARRIAIVEITLNDWPSIEPEVNRVALAIDEATESSYRVVEIAWNLE